MYFTYYIIFYINTYYVLPNPARDNNGSTHPPTHETITDPRIHHWDPPLGSNSTYEPQEPNRLTHAPRPRAAHATRCPNPAAADSDAKKRPPPLALRAAIPTRPPPASRCPTPEQRAPPRYCIPRLSCRRTRSAETGGQPGRPARTGLRTGAGAGAPGHARRRAPGVPYTRPDSPAHDHISRTAKHCRYTRLIHGRRAALRKTRTRN